MRIEGEAFIVGLLAGGLIILVITFSLGLFNLDVTEEPVESFIQVKICDEYIESTFCVCVDDYIDVNTGISGCERLECPEECIRYHYEWVKQEAKK